MFTHTRQHPVGFIFCCEYPKVPVNHPLLVDLHNIPYATSFSINQDHFKLLSYSKESVYWTRVFLSVLEIMKKHNIDCIGFGKDELTIGCAWRNELFLTPRRKTKLEFLHQGKVHKFKIPMVDGDPDCTEKKFWARIQSIHSYKWFKIINDVYGIKPISMRIAKYC